MFESKSLEIIKKVIQEEQLGHLSKHLKIFTKKDKSYYSSLRKKDIFFDITIEVWPPGATRYSLIYIIECKSYSKRVPVDDIEEFYSKIQQVSGVNVKAIFISNAPLQEGGFNVAESIGMMVIQGESANNYNIILHKATRQWAVEDQNCLPFITATLHAASLGEGDKLIEKLIDRKLTEIFRKNQDARAVSYNIDKLTKVDIEGMANVILGAINPKIVSEAYPLSVKQLENYLKEQEKIKIIDFADNDSLLGWCNIKANMIGVNRLVTGSSRHLFILAHEYGHFCLHQKLQIGQESYDQFADSEYNFRKNSHDLKNPKNWIEWQANYFASSLILPKPQFLARLWRVQDDLQIRRGKFYLDDQYHNRRDFMNLTKKMAYFFNVTKTSVIYKMHEMDLIVNNSKLRSVGQIISEYQDDLFPNVRR